MKKLQIALVVTCLLFLITGHAQLTRNYDQQWKKVNEYQNKSLPKSALAEVKTIYDLARKENQDAQVVKALIYMALLQQETREKNEVLSIAEMEKELAGFERQGNETTTAILSSLLANQYWSYYQAHRWNLMSNTATVNFVKTDIATWAAEDFYKKTGELYLRSVKDEKTLKQTRLESYDALLIKGNMRHLRPTLFDLLANTAIAWFENDERDVNKPAYAFEIDQAAAFDPAADFITRKFPTKDSLSLYQKALLLYQRLIAFHLTDAKPDALIDIDIQRLEFVHNKSVHPDKDQLYITALNHVANLYKDMPAASQASYLMAAWYESQAQQYKPYGDSTHRLDRVKAKTICEKIIAQKDSSEGKINCINLLTQINAVSFQFNLEKVNVPNQPFRALVQYKNVSKVYFHLIKLDEKLKKSLENRYEDVYWTTLSNATAVKSWEQALPATNDYLLHTVEIKVDALPAGQYALVGSSNETFTNKKASLAATPFYVSSISYVNNGDDYFVLNRDNGQPLAGATVQVWKQEYNYEQSKYIKSKAGTYSTDANGFFRMKKEAGVLESYRNEQYQLEITYNKETLYMNDYINEYRYYPEDNGTELRKNVFLFTDRSLYRPGQTAYFKGIALTKAGLGKADIVAGYSTIIYLNNTNGEHIDSIKVTTNEYGSFAGKFQLPQAGLNGSFSLQMATDIGYSSFRVEEYKRPKFYVDYEPIKETYKVNDSIKVTGYAKAYAGNNIDGATVKYRVVRQPRYIYYWMFSKLWQPPVTPLEIAHGETKTGKDGKFTISFTAIPDNKVQKKFDPLFDYTVYADITDINGETRSGQETITASYKALLLTAAIPSSIAVDSLKEISIRTENMSNAFQPALVKVTFTKLNQENRLLRERYWERPDQFIFTKTDYIRNFPYDEYDNESEPSSWDKGEKVLEKTDSTRENEGFTIPNAALKPGYYSVEVITHDKYGQEVKSISYIELYDEKANELARPQYLWAGGSRTVEPGETALLKLGTSADNLFVVQQVDKNKAGERSAPTVYSFTRLNPGKRNFSFTVAETDRGGFGVSWLFVKHNRVFQHNETISVPWTNKELNIEYATSRDKTLPGSEEKWKLRITGYKNEKVAAEVLASMYDASLDQFYPHSWSLPFIWPYYFNSGKWSGAYNFLQEQSMEKTWTYPVYRSLVKDYDNFIFAGTGNVVTVGYGVKSMSIRGIYKEAPAETLKKPGVQFERDAANINKSYDADTAAFAAAPVAPGFDFSLSAPPIVTQDPAVQVRKNFNETAFFFPELRTDSTGAVEFSFTMPEALTKWKFQALAHTKNLSFGYASKEIITQKQLMVQPNAPRFLREGDKMEFSSKIVNLTDKELTGQAVLQLVDAITNTPVDGWFRNMIPNQYFTIGAGQSEVVKFPIEIPYRFTGALTWRIVAKAGNISDGEENALPVLTNRMLVTETLPLWIRGDGKKGFTFDKLLHSGNSETLQHYALTVEYTSNPAWYAVQALPYLMEYPYECAEQTWNRYYANSLATAVANGSPRMKQIFEQWNIKDTAALLGNLQKNPELKSILLEETPWVLQAKNEAQQKKNIALLFDLVRMSNELASAYDKLKQLQSSNGGFVWFKGGPDDRYMTQYIVTGIGHLKKLNGIAGKEEDKLKAILAAAIPYLDKKIKQDYDELVKTKTDLKKYTPGATEIQYLYMRSFFPDYKLAAASQTAYNYFMNRAGKTWTAQNKYLQGMIALSQSRAGNASIPAAILKSLKETSITAEELGMYWKDAQRSWWWYESPIERQSLLIEAFQEISKDTKTADDLRTWLLKNKQTNSWESTKATAEACYALLLQGTSWLNNEPAVEIDLGPAVMKNTGAETGTGYFKKTIEGKNVTPDMGNISLIVGPSKGSGETSWGSVYWQYFEDLDKITTATTPLNLNKKLFVETNTDRGPVLNPVKEGDVLKTGDKIRVRIELRVDRDMEYVHMKDMRASCLEPVNVLSEYKWQNSLGYYESTKDASTNFFFSSLRKGTYVFEYPLFITHAGNFSNGVTSIQCMYAPEFSAHSEGIRISVE